MRASSRVVRVASMANRAELEVFIRDTLGCQCPDRVFEDLECESGAGRLFAALGPAAPLVDRVIRCADRLLVLESSRITTPEEAARLVAAGHALRDQLHLNRVRLAIHGFAMPEAELLRGHDERVHVHWL